MKENVSNEALGSFLIDALRRIYMGEAVKINPSRFDGFRDSKIEEEMWLLEHMSTGWFRTIEMLVVKNQNNPVWSMSIYGVMSSYERQLVRDVYDFLKKVLGVNNKGFISFRGPEYLMIGKWEYRYEQEGDIEAFIGKEEILHQKQMVYRGNIVGGRLVYNRKV